MRVHFPDFNDADDVRFIPSIERGASSQREQDVPPWQQL
jgi:hypothetical protein